MPTDGHNKGHEAKGDTSPVHGTPVDAEHPGYETTDVNVRGVAIFLTGLFATVFVFFYFCFYMGRMFNTYWQKEDGQPANGRSLQVRFLPRARARTWSAIRRSSRSSCSRL